jgi:hypothetical protein
VRAVPQSEIDLTISCELRSFCLLID